MTYKYFVGVKNEEELKAKFRELAKQLHPDRGGSHNEFTSMQNEYEYVLERAIYPISSTFFDRLKEAVETSEKEKKKYPATPEESLTPEQLNNLKAQNFFNTKRATDLIYDVIDTILDRHKKEQTNRLWVYQEAKKLYGLELDHFKYLAWKLGDPISLASVVYKQYQLV